MDLNTKQNKKVLTLEARHSKSLEASKEISTKLSPRFFMPNINSTADFKKSEKPIATKNQATAAASISTARESVIKKWADKFQIIADSAKDAQHKNVQILATDVVKPLKNSNDATIRMEQTSKTCKKSQTRQPRNGKSSKTTTDQRPKKGICNTKAQIIKDFNVAKEKCYIDLAKTTSNQTKDLKNLSNSENCKITNNVKENINTCAANVQSNAGSGANHLKEKYNLQNTVENRVSCPEINLIVDAKRQQHTLSSRNKATLDENKTNLKQNETVTVTETENKAPVQNFDEKKKKLTNQKAGKKIVLESADVTKTNLLENKTGATNQYDTNNKYSIEMLIKDKYSSDSGLQTVATAVADFQNAVRSSISLIYDCSPIDQQINEDLLSLDSCVENFSKYILHITKDINDQQLKTDNGLKYLKNMDMERKKLMQPDRSTLSEQPETLTIFIEADSLPRKSITFKTADILNPTQMTNNPEQNPVYVTEGFGVNSNNVRQATSTHKAPTATITSDSILPASHTTETQANIQSSNMLDMKKSKQTNVRKLKRKVTPKKKNPLKAKLQILTTPATEAVANFTNSSNVIYTQTQPQPPDNGYMGTNILRNFRPVNSNNSINIQPVSENPIGVPRCYVYPPSTEMLNNSRMPVVEEIRTTNLYRPFQNFSREPPIEEANENLIRFQYHSSLLTMPVYHNYYLEHASESQTVNNFATTNFTAHEDAQFRRY